MMDLRTVVAHNEDCPVREVGQGLVILSPDGGLTHSIEDLGAFIWKQMDGKRTLDDILAAIVASYEVTPEVAREDLLDFVTRLREAKLIKIL